MSRHGRTVGAHETKERGLPGSRRLGVGGPIRSERCPMSGGRRRAKSRTLESADDTLLELKKSES
jgi:hypothetical protein